MRRIAIGQVLGAHGYKGEVRVDPLTDFPERFFALKWVYLGEERRRREVQSVRNHDRFFLVKLEGIRDEEEAHSLCGSYLFLPRQQLVPLPPDQFYIWQLEGLEVFTTCGQPLGFVEEVLIRPANDVYVVRAKDGRQLLVPALKEVVVEVDVKGNRMIVAPGPSLEWEGEVWTSSC